MQGWSAAPSLGAPVPSGAQRLTMAHFLPISPHSSSVSSPGFCLPLCMPTATIVTVPFLILKDRAGHPCWVLATEGSVASPSLFSVNHWPPACPRGFPGLFLPMGQVGRQISALSYSLRSTPAAKPLEYCGKYVHICVHNKRAGVYEW